MADEVNFNFSDAELKALSKEAGRIGITIEQLINDQLRKEFEKRTRTSTEAKVVCFKPNIPK